MYGLTPIPFASQRNRPRTRFHSPLEPFNARLSPDSKHSRAEFTH